MDIHKENPFSKEFKDKIFPISEEFYIHQNEIDNYIFLERYIDFNSIDLIKEVKEIVSKFKEEVHCFDFANKTYESDFPIYVSNQFYGFLLHYIWAVYLLLEKNKPNRDYKYFSGLLDSFLLETKITVEVISHVCFLGKQQMKEYIYSYLVTRSNKEMNISLLETSKFNFDDPLSSSLSFRISI